MSPGIWQIIIVALIAILLLGGGRFSSMMGDVATGIKNFKKGMTEEEEEEKRKEPSRLESKPASEPEAKYDRDTDRVREDR